MDNPPIKFSSKNPKARVDYQCSACGGRIPKGMRYRRDSGLWGGKFSSFLMHTECRNATDLFDEYQYGYDIFNKAHLYDWLWNYSPTRYKFKKERRALAGVLKMLRRVDPAHAQKIALRGRITLLNNRRWSNSPWLSSENYLPRKLENSGTSAHLE